MKLIEAVALHKALTEIAAASAKDPKDFSISVKLAVAENLRAVGPNNADFQALRDSLITEHGTPVLDKPGQFTFTPEAQAKFFAGLKTLGDQDVKPTFRTLKESDLNGSALTVDQLVALQTHGILTK